jgi:hypothetical protein
MCQSVVTPGIPGLGSVSLILRAGGGDTPVRAENLYIDVANLEADATFHNIDIGVAAKDANKGPGMKGGNEQANPYGFAQQADSATLKKVKQTAWATTAGTFKLSGLKMSLSTGVKECY